MLGSSFHHPSIIPASPLEPAWLKLRIARGTAHRSSQHPNIPRPIARNLYAASLPALAVAPRSPTFPDDPAVALPASLPEMADLLGSSLDRGLPGLPAQMAMVPRNRAMTGLPVEDYRRAAVLIALYRDGEDRQWRLPLILRTEDGRVHSGQVSLPGGRLREGETDEAGALREAQEEVGLDPGRVNVVGRLTPVPIPVSRHLVVPVLGLIKGEGRANDLPWSVSLQEREVQDLFTIDMFQLLDPRLRRRETRDTVAGPMEVPYFAFQGHKVWGATAIILAELSSIVQELDAEYTARLTHLQRNE